MTLATIFLVLALVGCALAAECNLKPVSNLQTNASFVLAFYLRYAIFNIHMIIQKVGSIKKEMDAQCGKVKDIKAHKLIPMLNYIKESIDKEPGFKKMQPKSLSIVLGTMSKIMSKSKDINICTKEGAEKLQGKIIPEVMFHVPELKANYDQHCQDYYDYLGTEAGKKFLKGISQRISAMK